MLDFSLPQGMKRATFGRIYSGLELHRAVLRVYTKPLFAWRKALSCSHDGRTLYDFARHTAQNVDLLHRLLSAREFHFREGLAFHYNFNGKRRTIYIFPWEERIVDVLLYQTLTRYFHAAFSPRSYAYRHRGFGVDACQRDIARALRRAGEPLYFFKRDVSNYFPSIDHDILLDGLREWIDPDDYLWELILERVKFRFRDGEQTLDAARGAPFGAAIACWLANVYLTPLDRRLRAFPGLRYFRYADDLLAFTPDRGEALAARAAVEETLRELRLSSKPSQHVDFQFGADDADRAFPPAEKFRHLGLEFRRDGSVGLSRDKQRKIRNRFRFAFRRSRRKFARLVDPMKRAQLAVDIAREVVEQGLRSVAIIDYYLKHVDDEDQLRLLDRWLAEEVLALAFQNGHRKGNFRRLPFKRLREMGLPSLRHRRRLLRHGHIRSSFFTLRTERLIEHAARQAGGRRA